MNEEGLMKKNSIKFCLSLLTLTCCFGCSLNVTTPIITGPEIVFKEDFDLPEDAIVELQTYEIEKDFSKYTVVINKKLETEEKTVTEEILEYVEDPTKQPERLNNCISIDMYIYPNEEIAKEEMFALMNKWMNNEIKPHCVNCIYPDTDYTEEEMMEYFESKVNLNYSYDQAYALVETVYIRQENRLLRLYSNPHGIFLNPSNQTIEAINRILDYDFSDGGQTQK